MGGLVGLSYGWWIGKHNRHHANPNHEQDDPDLDLPVLAFSIGQSGAKRGLARWMAKYQAFLFFPLLLLEGLSLHRSSIRSVWRGEVRLRGLEKALLIGHVAVYLTAVFFVLSPVTAVVFIAVHQGVYMGSSFPNMPRPNLRRAQPTVQGFRAERGISYSQCGLLRSYGQVLRHLHAVGAPLRATPR